MRVALFVAGIYAARLDRRRHRRAANVILIENDDAFEFSEAALHVVPKVPDHKLDSRIRWIEMPNVTHCQLSNPRLSA